MNLPAAPAWTFKGKPKTKVKYVAPGPGAYSPETKTESKFDSAPTYRIGTSSRDKFLMNGVPGPGTYTSGDVRPHSSAPVIGSSQRPPLNECLATPGPGTYEIIKGTSEAPQYSMVGRGEYKASSNSPGPGHYEQDLNDFTTRERAPTYRIGSASRTDRGNGVQVPGPGTYDTRGKEVGPKWAFGTESKNKNFKLEVPGPGTYQVPDGMSKTAYSLTGRKPDTARDNFPGPGTYSPETKVESKFDKSPNYTIGTSSRDKFFLSGVPGPGTYSAGNIRPHSHAPIIGNSKRPPLSDTVETPGPGTYEINQKAVEGPQFTMVGRGNYKGGSNSPGPGHYEQDLNDFNTKERAPTYRIGTEARTSRPQTSGNPGPGTYDSQGKDLGPKWGFGSEPRIKNFTVENPGPGTYQIPDAMCKTAFSITGRKADGAKDNFPGPGTYNHSARPKSPSWTMGKTARLDFNGDFKGVPGPGTYSPKEGLKTSGAVFGTSTRPPLSNIQSTPGPGEYNHGNKANQTPAYTMRPRTGNKKANEVPGPGQYDPKTNAGDPKWTVGKDKKGLDYGIKKSASLPGPGFYDVRKGLGGPKWGFGSSSRNKDAKVSIPGPGQYDYYSSISNLPNYAATKHH